MALPAVKFEAENNVEARVTRLEEKVDRLQSDMTEVKADVRRADAKIDSLQKSVVDLDSKTQASISALELKSERSLAGLNVKLIELDKSIGESLGTIRLEMQKSFAALNRSRHLDRIWFLLISAAILGLVGRAF
jgi:chromosome segregation ATPase